MPEPGKPDAMAALDIADINARLEELGQSELHTPPTFELSKSIDSTNAAALRAAGASASGTVWLAEQQSAGRGRRGKYWHSPESASIYFSMLWHFDEVSGLDGLSLAVGVVAAELLERMGVASVALKWPNDVLCEHRKLGGILLEMQMRNNGRPSVVMGIGLNIALPEAEAKQIDQPWTDVSSHVDACPSRNQIVAELAYALCEMLPEFEGGGFAAFMERWNHFDYLSGQHVDILAADSTRAGLALGVADDGALLVSIDEQIQSIYGGEVSVRARRSE